MSIEWRGSGAIGDGILISTLTAGALPMMAKEGNTFSYYEPVLGPGVAQNSGNVVNMGAMANSVVPYYSTIGGVVSTISNPSGAVLPLVIKANLSQAYFSK